MYDTKYYVYLGNKKRMLIFSLLCHYSYAGIATHYVPAKNLPELEGAIQDLATKSDSRLDLDDINKVAEYFSADLDIDAPPFSLGGNGIYQAINRYNVKYLYFIF